MNPLTFAMSCELSQFLLKAQSVLGPQAVACLYGIVQEGNHLSARDALIIENVLLDIMKEHCENHPLSALMKQRIHSFLHG